MPHIHTGAYSDLARRPRRTRRPLVSLAVVALTTTAGLSALAGPVLAAVSSSAATTISASGPGVPWSPHGVIPRCAPGTPGC